MVTLRGWAKRAGAAQVQRDFTSCALPPIACIRCTRGLADPAGMTLIQGCTTLDEQSLRSKANWAIYDFFFSTTVHR